MKIKKILIIIGGGLVSVGFFFLVFVFCFDINKLKDENSIIVEKLLLKIFNGIFLILISVKDEKLVFEVLKLGNNFLKIDDLRIIIDEKENKIIIEFKDGISSYSDKVVIFFVVKF